MNKIAINTFDVRLSYLTEKEIEQSKPACTNSLV